jgi:hypothetical protein
MKAYTQVELLLHTILTTILGTSNTNSSTPRERTMATHKIGGSVGPGADLGVLEKKKSLAPAGPQKTRTPGIHTRILKKLSNAYLIRFMHMHTHLLIAADGLIHIAAH